MSDIATFTPSLYHPSLIKQTARQEIASRPCMSIIQFIKALELDYMMSEMQLQHILVMVDPREREVLLIRSRGGSKTFDAMIVGLYYAYLGFKVIFWAPSQSQMDQPKEYLEDLTANNFLRYCIKEQVKLAVKFDTGGWLKIKNLTPKQARSPRCDLEIFDEQSQSDEVAYNASSPVLSVSRIKKMIHLSTPVKPSIFEANYRRMKAEGKPILIMRWDQCAHMNQDAEFMAKELKTKPRWWIRQEYFCSFEAPSGRVFTNVLEGVFDLSQLKTDYSRTHNMLGVDWNPVAGHYVVTTRWDDSYNNIYVIAERNMGTDYAKVVDSIFQLMEKDEHMLCELEDGGTNSGYCDSFFAIAYARAKTDEKLKNIMRRISRRSWDSAGKNKHQTITNLFNAIIHVNPLITPNVAYWLSAASWEEDKRDNTYKLAKDTEQHPLDSFLHSSWIGDRGVKH